MQLGKKNIAIIIPGGIGTGHNNIGVPVLERTVKLLSNDFHITVFSLFKINKNYIQHDFELISISGSGSLTKVLKFLFIFIRFHRQKKFQVVHGFWAMPSGFLAVVIGKIFQIKSIVSILGGDAVSLPEIGYGQLQKEWSKKLILWTLAQADEVISLTQYLVDNLKVLGLKRDIKIIPWGIDISQFAFRAKPLTNPIQFLHIATLSPVKDQRTLLTAFKIISDKADCVLTIIGEGNLADTIKLYVKELYLQDKVTFLGLLPYNDLPMYYQNAHLLLHTSLSEGQSEVVTEAMSSGVIVCGTKVGLLYDQPACCLSVSVRDAESLGNEVLKLLKDSQRMHLLRQNALAWSCKHPIQWTADMISKLYKKLMSSNV